MCRMIYSANGYFKRTEFPAPVPLESVLNADEAPLSLNEPVTCRTFVFFQSFHDSCLFSTCVNYSLHLCQPMLIPAVAASVAESGPFPKLLPQIQQALLYCRLAMTDIFFLIMCHVCSSIQYPQSVTLSASVKPES